MAKRTLEEKRKADRERKAAKRAAKVVIYEAAPKPNPAVAELPVIEIPRVEVAKPKKSHFGPRKSDNPALQALYDERCRIQREWDGITKQLKGSSDAAERSSSRSPGARSTLRRTRSSRRSGHSASRRSLRCTIPNARAWPGRFVLPEAGVEPMTRGVCYARKSNEQRVAEEHKSVTRQLANARVFAESRGWTIVASFQDDAISGAEFEKRPGLQCMLAAARAHQFDVLIVAEQKALGREMLETGGMFKLLSELGVDVWSYMEKRILTPRTTVDKMLTAVQGFADEHHRTASAARVYEGHQSHAQKQHVVGGRLYGYRNVDFFSGTDAHGRPLRSHVERAINPEEAEVVIRIFELAAAGQGLKAIARTLTAERVLAPRYGAHKGQAGQPWAWAPSTVQGILAHEEYLGWYIWNRSKKRNVWGKVAPSRKPDNEWIRVEMPELRIITDYYSCGRQSRLADSGWRARPSAAHRAVLVDGRGRTRPRPSWRGSRRAACVVRGCSRSVGRTAARRGGTAGRTLAATASAPR